MGIVKITKKELDSAFNNATSIFFGLLKNFPTEEQCLHSIKMAKQNIQMVEIRKSTVHATYIEFTGGSRVDTVSHNDTVYTFHRLQGTDMYFIRIHSKIDATYQKIMAYLII